MNKKQWYYLAGLLAVAGSYSECRAAVVTLSNNPRTACPEK
jgi:hypothetical protein